MEYVPVDPRPVAPVPDTVMASFLEAARITLEAAWAVADVANPIPHPVLGHAPNPKGPCVESLQSLDAALKAAFCGDGADAVIGYAMVTRSLARKALDMRAQGVMGIRLRTPTEIGYGP